MVSSIKVILGFPTCLVHGDLWAPNIMLEKDENQKARNTVNAIIDWQTFFIGKKLNYLPKKLQATLVPIWHVCLVLIRQPNIVELIQKKFYSIILIK